MQNKPDSSKLSQTRNQIIREQVNIITPILSEKPEIVIEIVEQAINDWENGENKSIEQFADPKSNNPLSDIMKILNLERKYLNKLKFSRAVLDRSMEESYDFLKKSLLYNETSKFIQSLYQNTL